MHSNKKVTVNISEFKAKALRLIDRTATRGECYVITKLGVPVAEVVPIAKKRETTYGSLKGIAKVQGDIVNFDFSDDWEANE
jgi:hypothetical protein